MTSSIDVAEFILQQKGPISSVKLQRLVYYSQVWSLALDGKNIFEEPIEAWKNGPVVRNLLEKTRYNEQIPSVHSGDPSLIDEDSKDTIIAVLIYYGQKSDDWLQNLVHNEEPWIETRENASKCKNDYNDVSYNVTISQNKMREYYANLDDIYWEAENVF